MSANRKHFLFSYKSKLNAMEEFGNSKPLKKIEGDREETDRKEWS
jgi:hypothetical protein